MQLVKTLVGALIGGALGIGLLILIHSFTGWDKAWLAIPVALLTGLGVRWMVSTKGHPSYARGALTAVFAVLAFLVWYPIEAKLATSGNIGSAVAIRAPDQAEEDAADAEDQAEAAPAVEPMRLEDRAIGGGGMRNARPQQFSPWDYLFLCLAALIAYELGRGTGTPTPATTAVRDDEVAPLGVGQSAMPPD